MLFIYLLANLIWAVICFGLAERKGQNKAIAFFLGEILGLFAVICYLIISPNEKSLEK